MVLNFLLFITTKMRLFPKKPNGTINVPKMKGIKVATGTLLFLFQFKFNCFPNFKCTCSNRSETCVLQLLKNDNSLWRLSPSHICFCLPGAYNKEMIYKIRRGTCKGLCDYVSFCVQLCRHLRP